MNTRSLTILLLLLALAGAATAQRGGFKAVKTSIAVHYKGGIAPGDTIIAYGTGVNTGVDYIKPGDTKGRGIPGSERFRSAGFAAAGDKVVFIDNSEFTYHVFDTATGKVTDIPGLQNRGASSLQSSGNYVLAITLNRRTNKEGVAVIDLSGNTPAVMELPLPKDVVRVSQAAIDVASGYVAVTDGYEKVGAYLFKSGDAEPIPHDITGTSGMSNEPMAITGGSLYYFDRKSGVHSVYELNLRTGDSRKLAVNPATFRAAGGGGTVAYFARRDAKDMNGTEARLVVMKNGGTPAVVVPGDQFLDGSTRNNGMAGFGNTIAVTPDGKFVFISGADSIGATETLQYYDGTGIKFVSDPAGSSRSKAMPATDVAASANLVAFKTGSNNNTVLAYIKLM